MDEDPSNPPRPTEPERSDAAARASDLGRHAGAASDATFGEDEAAARSMVPGVLTGDVGPKGKIAAQHRSLSRTERATYGEVPRGTVAPGGGRYLLATMFLIAFLLLGLAALVGWAVSR